MPRQRAVAVLLPRAEGRLALLHERMRADPDQARGSQTTWWQIFLMFAGIPTAIFILVAGVVLRFGTTRAPAAARLHCGQAVDDAAQGGCAGS